MSDENKSFGKTAEKLSRNPLGIIALFIVLAHAFASLTLTFSNRLQNGQQWALVSFIVLFPVIVLSIFTRLVVKHHIKLYAPADFRSDESFFKSVSHQQLKSENVALSIDVTTDAAIALESKDTNDNEDNDSSKMIHSSEYLIAVDLALRKIETSLNEPVRRQAAVTAFDGSIKFDGLIIQDDLVTGVGVIFIKNVTHISTDILDGIFSAAIKASNYLVSIGRRFSFMLVIVVDDENVNSDGMRKSLEKLILDRITNKFPSAFEKVHVPVLDFELLKEEFSVT